MARKEVTGKRPGITSPAEEAPIPQLAMSVAQFCTAHAISIGMFYKLRRKGRSPREMRIGTRTLITFEDAAVWRAERVADIGAKEAAKISTSRNPATRRAFRPTKDQTHRTARSSQRLKCP